jgi:SAM-dependent methyltransferase
VRQYGFPVDAFARYDETDDTQFYLYPRLTAHIDDAACRAVTQLIREEVPTGSHVLDLMSSYVSHLPTDCDYSGVVGVGLNADEMRLNPQLTDYRCCDLNRDPRLPYADAAFDAAFCTVSVQYLTRPIEVFREVARVLRPNAPFIVSFSNRCFPSKAVRIWVAGDNREHSGLVQRYFALSNGFSEIRAVDRSPHRWLSDPLYAVIGRRRVV